MNKKKKNAQCLVGVVEIEMTLMRFCCKIKQQKQFNSMLNI